MTRKRLQVFSQFTRDESPPSDNRTSEPTQEYSLRFNIRILTEEVNGKNENESKVNEVKDEASEKRAAPNGRRRISKFCLKPSNTLKLSSIAQDQLTQLQESLSQFGAIKSMNTAHIQKG